MNERHFGAILGGGLVVLGSVGCFSVPEPPPPKLAARSVGADLSQTAVGHWSCPATDIVLAKRGSGFVLHELNLDAIASQAKPVADGRMEFTIGLGQSTYVYAVSQDVTQPAWVFMTIVSGGGMTINYDHPYRAPSNPNEVIFSSTIENKTQKQGAVLCPPAPLPRFL